VIDTVEKGYSGVTLLCHVSKRSLEPVPLSADSPRDWILSAYDTIGCMIDRRWPRPRPRAHESDRAICSTNVHGAAALAERQARGLGDCSEFAIQCRAMGYPAGHPQHLHCRQTLAQEYAAYMSGGPTVCTKAGNSVICN
jgi:hypothetical protein